MRKQGFTLVEMLVVLAIVGILASITALSVPRFAAEADRRGVESESATILAAIDSYNTQDVAVQEAALIPARIEPAQIGPADADAPFAKYLQDRGSRYAYTWGEGGTDLQGFGSGDTLSARMQPGLTTVQEVVQRVLAMDDTDHYSFAWGYGASQRDNWNMRIELLLEQGSIDPPYRVAAGENAVGIANPISGKGAIMDIWTIPRGWIPTYTPPAVLITVNPTYSFQNVASASLIDELHGTIIVYRRIPIYGQSPQPVQVYYVDDAGQPRGLEVFEVAEAKEASPERGPGNGRNRGKTN